jgi:hypothetical protein
VIPQELKATTKTIRLNSLNWDDMCIFAVNVK